MVRVRIPFGRARLSRSGPVSVVERVLSGLDGPSGSCFSWTLILRCDSGYQVLKSIRRGVMVEKEPSFTLTATVLDAVDARALAAFYHRLFPDWVLRSDEPGWATLRMPGGGGLSFQDEPNHVPPVWP